MRSIGLVLAALALSALSACGASGGGGSGATAQLRVLVEGDGTVEVAGTTVDKHKIDWIRVVPGVVTLHATPGPTARSTAFAKVETASGNTATLTVNEYASAYVYFPAVGATPVCPTISTPSCTHGTFSSGGATVPLTFASGLLVDAAQFSCTPLSSGALRPISFWACADRYVCGSGPYAFDVDIQYVDASTTTPSWQVQSTVRNWFGEVLCDGVCTGSGQCGFGYYCNAGHCVVRPGGGDACSACLDSCRGLPGCCTGEGCICQSDC
jgi:hypothetical protein